MKPLYVMVAIAAVILSFPFRPPLHAATSFHQVTIHLDRLKGNTPTTGMVCAMPRALSSENKLEITFPATFTVNTNASAWTVSTGPLPQGAVAWPGIGTAIGVSGNVVTFPSSDLTSGNLYCFHWSSNTLTTPAAGDDYAGSITTYAAGNVVIDSSPYAISIMGNDQIAVTATVLPNASDIESDIIATPSAGTVLHEGESTTITIRYRSQYATNTPLTIIGSWEKGTIQNTSNMIDAIHFVGGSATDSDDGTAPVIDLQNNIVIWDISSLPPSIAFHSVSFTVRVLSTLPTRARMNVPVSSELRVANTPLDQDSLTLLVQGSDVPSTTPQPTAIQNATNTPGPSATPTTIQSTPAPLTPGPVVQPGDVTITLDEVINTSGKIHVTTANPTTYSLTYGIHPNALSQVITSDIPSRDYDIVMPDLIPNTRYYFRIAIVDGNSKTVSDIYTFKTTSQTAFITIHNDHVVISSHVIPLTSSSQHTAIVPRNIPITITFSLDDSSNIARIAAHFVNRNVLGITSTGELTPVGETSFVEVLPHTFSADIRVPSVSGTYDLVATIYDIYGSKYTRSFGESIIVTDPLRITRRDGSPIEGAHVMLERYEGGAKRYTSLSSVITHPIYTNENGEVEEALPIGRYHAEISAVGFVTRNVQFDVDQKKVYPAYTLESQNGFINIMSSYGHSLITVCVFFARTGSEYFGSAMSTETSAFLASIGIILALLLLLTFRTHAGILASIIFLPWYLVVYGMNRLDIHHLHKLLIVEYADTLRPISGCQVDIPDSSGTTHRFHTGIWGETLIPQELIRDKNRVEVVISRKGFTEQTVTFDESSLTQDVLYATIKKESSSISQFTSWFVESCLIAAYDSLLLFCFATSFMFGYYRGVMKTLPLIIATLVLFILWIIYLYNVWKFHHRTHN